jgi:hypothetical protein
VVPSACADCSDQERQENDKGSVGPGAGAAGVAGVSDGLEENTMSDETKTLFERLRGYDAITAVADDLLPRLHGDPQLGRSGRMAGAPEAIAEGADGFVL